MDTLRGNFEALEDSHGHEPGEDEPGREAPPLAIGLLPPAPPPGTSWAEQARALRASSGATKAKEARCTNPKPAVKVCVEDAIFPSGFSE